MPPAPSSAFIIQQMSSARVGFNYALPCVDLVLGLCCPVLGAGLMRLLSSPNK